MAECICLPTCAFFNDKMGNMPATAAMMKTRYCLGDSSQCARHMVFSVLGREAVPATLYPAQVDRAREILAGAR
jgi:hypothetical protein